MKAYYTTDAATAVQAAENLWGEKIFALREASNKAIKMRISYLNDVQRWREMSFWERVFAKPPQEQYLVEDLDPQLIHDEFALWRKFNSIPPFADIHLDVSNLFEFLVAEECKRIVEASATCQ